MRSRNSGVPPLILTGWPSLMPRNRTPPSQFRPQLWPGQRLLRARDHGLSKTSGRTGLDCLSLGFRRPQMFEMPKCQLLSVLSEIVRYVDNPTDLLPTV